MKLLGKRMFSLCRNGSVDADVLLEFNGIVPITSVISELKAAAKIGRLGNLTVDPESIKLKRTTDSPTTPNTPTTLNIPATTTPTTTMSGELFRWLLCDKTKDSALGDV